MSVGFINVHDASLMEHYSCGKLLQYPKGEISSLVIISEQRLVASP
jgi:hypothetical protein